MTQESENSHLFTIIQMISRAHTKLNVSCIINVLSVKLCERWKQNEHQLNVFDVFCCCWWLYLNNWKGRKMWWSSFIFNATIVHRYRLIRMLKALRILNYSFIWKVFAVRACVCLREEDGRQTDAKRSPKMHIFCCGWYRQCSAYNEHQYKKKCVCKHLEWSNFRSNIVFLWNFGGKVRCVLVCDSNSCTKIMNMKIDI